MTGKLEGCWLGSMPQRAALAWWRDNLSGDCEKTILRRSRKEAGCYRVLTVSDVFLAVAIFGEEGRVVVRWSCRLDCYSVDVFLFRQQRKSR